MPFAVCVDLEVAQEDLTPFMELMQSNAQTSLQEEPGCLQFDIAQDSAAPGRIFLYEVYTDAAAFEAHLASAHFKAFDGAAAAYLVSKSARTFDQVLQ